MENLQEILSKQLVGSVEDLMDSRATGRARSATLSSADSRDAQMSFAEVYLTQFSLLFDLLYAATSSFVLRASLRVFFFCFLSPRSDSMRPRHCERRTHLSAFIFDFFSAECIF